MTAPADGGWGQPYGGHPAQPGAPGQQPYGVALVAPQGWGTPYPYVWPVPRSSTNGLAIASMVLGIVWFSWLGSILAVVFGHVALSQIKRTPCSTGRGMAIAGLVLGYLWLALLVVVIVAVAMSDGAGGSAVDTGGRLARQAALAAG